MLKCEVSLIGKLEQLNDSQKHSHFIAGQTQKSSILSVYCYENQLPHSCNNAASGQLSVCQKPQIMKWGSALFMSPQTKWAFWITTTVGYASTSRVCADGEVLLPSRAAFLETQTLALWVNSNMNSFI